MLVKWQIVPFVQVMDQHVVNVIQDIIQMEHHVNYVIQFIHHVQNVLKQRRHVPHVPQDIMLPEEPVPLVQVK